MTITLNSTDPTTQSDALTNFIGAADPLSIENNVLITDQGIQQLINKPNQLVSNTFLPGTSLDSLATKYLGDPFGWINIAGLNKIDPTIKTDIGKIISTPTLDNLKSVLTNAVITNPQLKTAITSIENSVLSLTGVSSTGTSFATSLSACVSKIVDFKPILNSVLK